MTSQDIKLILAETLEDRDEILLVDNAICGLEVYGVDGSLFILAIDAKPEEFHPELCGKG